MLELANIRKAFNQGQHNEYWALKGIDIDTWFQEHEIVAHHFLFHLAGMGKGKIDLLAGLHFDLVQVVFHHVVAGKPDRYGAAIS